MNEKKLTTVCLADYVDDSARDLNSIATPGQATVLAELCDKNSRERIVHQVAHYPIQQYSKQGKQVSIFSPNTPGWTADTLFQAGCDNACIRHSTITNDTPANEIIEAAEGSHLCVLWMPLHVTGKQMTEYFEAANQIAESGPAVIFALRMFPKDAAHSGMPAIFETAGASVDGYFHRAWIVQDKASPINTTRCNLLTPLADPVAVAGYTFTVEGQRPVFNFQHRTKNAKQSTSLALPEITLAIPNAT